MKRLRFTPKIVAGLLIGTVLSTVLILSPIHADAASGSTSDGSSCSPGSGTFFGLAPWYAYLTDRFSYEHGICGFHTSFDTTSGTGSNSTVTGVAGGSSGLGVIWLIALAIFEDLLRIAGLAAVGFVIYGGIRYITSQGEPENTKGAQSTIINALIGLAIVVVAAGLVSFIGQSLGGG